MQEQTRKNMAMFEKALSMFSPFPVPGTTDPNAAATATPTQAPQGEQPHAKESSAANPSELAELKAQLKIMQTKIDKISGDS